MLKLADSIEKKINFYEKTFVRFKTNKEFSFRFLQGDPFNA